MVACLEGELNELTVSWDETRVHHSLKMEFEEGSKKVNHLDRCEIRSQLYIDPLDLAVSLRSSSYSEQKWRILTPGQYSVSVL